MNGSGRASDPIRSGATTRSLVVRHPARACAAAVGLVDVSVGVSYLLQVDVTTWYAMTLALKFAVVALLRAPGRPTVFFHLPAIAAFALLLIGSSWAVGASLSVWLAAGGFIAHLLMTLAAVRRDALDIYLKMVGFSGLGLAAIYDVMAIAGRVEIVYGRYQFFGGSHPNLGSEIFAMTLVAAAMSFDMRRFAIAAVIGLPAVVLMQGRAALLVMLLVCLVRVLQRAAEFKRTFLLLGLAVAITALIALFVDASREAIVAMLNSLFMVDDPYRGTSSGFVGRSARWEMAWDAFAESPLIGQGFGYYAATGMESAHNFYMYSLVEFGLLSVPIFGYAMWCLLRMWRSSAALFMRFLPVVVLTVFNDRFINLNPYPFVMIALVLVLSVRVLPQNGAWRTRVADGAILSR